MQTNKMRRLQRVETGISQMPIRPQLLDRAFEHFRETGELPDHQRLADAVARRVLHGRNRTAPVGGQSDIQVLVLQAACLDEPEPAPSMREMLLDEAVWGDDFIRRVARTLLRWFADCGEDPTDPQFLEDRTLPKHGSLCMHLLGYPERLAVPPYEEQARRLFGRYDELRERIDHDDQSWWESLTDAAVEFRLEGELPDDELMREAVLADAEFEALCEHKRGRDVRELMAAFERVQASHGQEHESALLELAALVAGENGLP